MSDREEMCCPEDVGFEEYIQSLKAKVADLQRQLAEGRAEVSPPLPEATVFEAVGVHVEHGHFVRDNLRPARLCTATYGFCEDATICGLSEGHEGPHQSPFRHFQWFTNGEAGRPAPPLKICVECGTEVHEGPGFCPKCDGAMRWHLAGSVIAGTAFEGAQGKPAPGDPRLAATSEHIDPANSAGRRGRGKDGES